MSLLTRTRFVLFFLISFIFSCFGFDVSYCGFVIIFLILLGTLCDS